MGDSFFGLTRRAFSLTPDPADFVPVGTAAAAMARLRRCVEQGDGVAVLTAPSGLGKTIACRRLLADLPPHYTAAFIPSADAPTRKALLQTILYELGQSLPGRDEHDLGLELQTFARQGHQCGRTLVVALDEAHLLRPRLLELVRTMTNWMISDAPLVRLILCGQLLLDERLAGSDAALLADRIAAHESLEPLTRQESAEYIARRLELAGGGCGEVYDSESLRLICEAADGVPRNLNLLCETSLRRAAEIAERPVRARTVRMALEELRHLSVAWNDVGHLSGSGRPSSSADEVQSERPPADPASSACAGCFDVGPADDTAVVGCIEFGAQDAAAWDTPANDLPEPQAPEFASAARVEADATAESGPQPASDMVMHCAGWTAPERAQRDTCEHDLRLDSETTAPADSAKSASPPAEDWPDLPEVAELRDEEARIAALEYHSSLAPGSGSPRAESTSLAESKAESAKPAVRGEVLRPDRVVEGVMPMVAAVLSDAMDEAPARPAAEEGARQSAMVPGRFPRLSPVRADDEIEARIHDLVQDTQRLLRSRHVPGDASDDLPLPPPSSRPRSAAGPVTDDDSAPSSPVEESHGSRAPLAPLPSRRYGRLFSSLRKRMYGDAQT